MAPAKKTEAAMDSDALVAVFVEAVKTGRLDSHLLAIDDALTARTESVIENETKNSAPVKSTEEKATPPRKKQQTVTPEKGKTYLLADGVKNVGGASVKFVRFVKGTDNEKSVIEMLEDKPGAPKGKQIRVPSAALRKAPAPKKRAVKKKPAKK